MGPAATKQSSGAARRLIFVVQHGGSRLTSRSGNTGAEVAMGFMFNNQITIGTFTCGMHFVLLSIVL